jgi:hypothetical protein
MATQTKVRSLYCNRCKQTPAHRRDLDERWLCAKCRVIPGVTGYRDPKMVGIKGGSPEYLKLNPITSIITDDAPAPNAGVRHWTEDADGNVIPNRSEILGGTLRAWRGDVFAARVASDVKVLLLKLADHADYDTEPTPGGNCFPSLRTLAEELGWPATRVRRTIAAARYSWLLIVEVEVSVGDGIKRASNQYLLRWPDGRQLSTANNKRNW